MRSSADIASLLAPFAELYIEHGERLAAREAPSRIHSEIHNIRDGFGALFFDAAPNWWYRCRCGVMRSSECVTSCTCGAMAMTHRKERGMYG